MAERYQKAEGVSNRLHHDRIGLIQPDT